MANANAPRGFLPVDFETARQNARDYRVAVTCTTAMAKGDLVDAKADGTVGRSAAGSVVITGVVLEFRWVDPYGIARKGTYLPAVNGLGYTDIWAVVIDDPMTRFVAQADTNALAGTTASQIADLNSNCDHIDTAPSQQGEYSGHSNQQLDIDTLATTLSTFRLEDRYPVEDNVFSATVADSKRGKYICRIIEHFRFGVSPAPVGTTPSAGV